MVTLAHARQAVVEAELGRLTGTEDGLTVPEYEAKFTDPAQAADFVAQTGIDALAVCIGNVHGRYRSEPRLDFDRLATIQRTVPVPLVLHGASGLPEAMVRRSIALGVRKFNVNTEVREAYVEALRSCLQAVSAPDVLDLMRLRWPCRRWWQPNCALWQRRESLIAVRSIDANQHFLFAQYLRQVPTASAPPADTGTRHGSYKLDDYYPFALRMGATRAGFHPGQIPDARPVPRVGQLRISGSRWGDL